MYTPEQTAGWRRHTLSVLFGSVSAAGMEMVPGDLKATGLLRHEAGALCPRCQGEDGWPYFFQLIRRGVEPEDISGGKMYQCGKDWLAAIVSFVAWFLPFQCGSGSPTPLILA